MHIITDAINNAVGLKRSTALFLMMLFLTCAGAHAQSFSKDSLDFGLVYSCDTARYRELTVRLRAPGAPATVTSVSIGPRFTTSLAVGTVVTDSVDATVRFTPTLFGVYENKIRIVLNSSSDTLEIVLQGGYINVAGFASISGIDFGILDVGGTSSQRIVWRNTGMQDVEVVPLESVTPPFTVIDAQPPLPALVAPGDSVVIWVQYEYAGTGRFDNKNIVLRTVGRCPTTTTFRIQGRTTGAVIRSVVLAIPTNLFAHPGDAIVIPISLQSPTNISPAEVRTMHIEISYNATMLRALRVSDISGIGIVGTVTETSPGKAIIELISSQAMQAAAPLDASKPLFALHAKTYLGNSSQTILVVDSVSASGLEISGQDGMLTMLGACNADARSIAFGAPVTLVARHDRVGSIIIEFTTLTNDNVNITIADLRGVERVVAIAGVVEPTRYNLTIDASQLETGAYMVVMRHGLHTRTAKVLVAP